MGEKEKPRLWTGLLCTTDNRASGWQADHGRMDEVVGCTCHDKRTEMAGNDDTPKRIKNEDGKIWQSPVRELEKYKKIQSSIQNRKLADRCLWMVSMAG